MGLGLGIGWVLGLGIEKGLGIGLGLGVGLVSYVLARVSLNHRFALVGKNEWTGLNYLT